MGSSSRIKEAEGLSNSNNNKAAFKSLNYSIARKLGEIKLNPRLRGSWAAAAAVEVEEEEKVELTVEPSSNVLLAARAQRYQTPSRVPYCHLYSDVPSLSLH